jgi:hypothetical protein
MGFGPNSPQVRNGGVADVPPITNFNPNSMPWNPALTFEK